MDSHELIVLRGNLPADSIFTRLSDDEIATHMRIKKYGQFILTQAVGPAYDFQPESGFKYLKPQDNESGRSVPIIAVSVSSQKILDLFFELARLLGGQTPNNTVTIFLMTSHFKNIGEGLLKINGEPDLGYEGQDIFSLLSILAEYENLLLNDGCTGIAITSQECKMEVALDEHKTIFFYNYRHLQDQILDIFKNFNIQEKPSLRLIAEGEHLHKTERKYIFELDRLMTRLEGNS